jgi:hypothetical protein
MVELCMGKIKKNVYHVNKLVSTVHKLNNLTYLTCNDTFSPTKHVPNAKSFILTSNKNQLFLQPHST